ncbi:MAG: hypothetical protein FWG07_06055 [Treponema sp.]|nr:hypothetical protein [Treponema sp.]
MKNTIKWFWIMAVLTLLFGFVLAGCVTYTWEETDTSRAIHEAASELVRSNDGRISADALVSGLGRVFPGLKYQPVQGILGIEIKVNYGGTTTWPTTYKIVCKWDGGNIVTGIISVMENRTAKK